MGERNSPKIPKIIYNLNIPILGVCYGLQLISKQNGVGKVSMSGSGATCFGIFENKSDCDLALKKIQEQRPEWWTVSTQTKST